MTTLRSRGRLWETLFLVFLYICATVQWVRFYITDTIPMLNLPLYMAGQGPNPFQQRVLPAVVLRGLTALLTRVPGIADHHRALAPQNAALFLLALVSVMVAGLCAQALYQKASTHRRLSAAVFPVFLCTLMWSYTIHIEANFSYPYDLPSVAFFAAGLLAVYTRRFLPLLLIVFVGTFTRETTIFLVLLYVLDRLFEDREAQPLRTFGERMAAVPWLRVAALTVVWAAVKLTLVYRFRRNSAFDDISRITTNLIQLQPKYWPTLVDLCGYLLPALFLWRKHLPARFRGYLWIAPLWFAAMFYKGIITETRIFGELCPLVSVAVVLAAERYVGEARHEQSANIAP